MRSQTLPWFVLNFVGLITFIIVLIVVITLQKNVYVTAKSMDLRSSYLLMSQELISTRNCLAYEDRYITFVNSSSPHYQLNIYIQPGIIDLSKFKDFYHFNCIRYDYKYAKETSFIYGMKLLDISTGKYYNDLTGDYQYAYEYGQDGLISTPNCTNNYTDVIPVLVYDKGYRPALLYLIVCEDSGGKSQSFCEAKIK